MLRNVWICLAALFVFFTSDSAAESLGTEFTYQGELNHSGEPASGSFDLRFELFDAGSGGNAVAPAVELDNVPVVDGIFTVELDFGSEPFSSQVQLWLQVAVRPGDSVADHTGLSPRQKLTASPYAISALDRPHSDDVTVQVDCNNGGSINEALQRPARHLTIEIDGFCHEQVKVRRSQVTLTGSDPLEDGIKGGFPLVGQSSLLLLQGAYFVRAEKLQIAESTGSGITIEHGAGIVLDDILAKDNQGSGFFSRSARLNISNSQITGNLGGMYVRSGNVVVDNVSIIDNPGIANGSFTSLSVSEAADVRVYGSSLKGDAWGILARVGSRLLISDSEILLSTAGPVPGCCQSLNVENATVQSTRNRITGPIELIGAVLDSREDIQTFPAGWEGVSNTLDFGSTAKFSGDGQIAPATSITGFSKLIIEGATEMTGGLSCESGGDAWCPEPAINVPGGSDCGMCSLMAP